MNEHTLRDKNLNEDISKGLGVTNVEMKMKDNHLRWLSHAQRRVFVDR